MNDAGVPLLLKPDEGSVLKLPPDSAGSLLRRAREAEGLHIAALAVALKVPVRKIEALEADRLHELPDIVFARALASSACRALKIAPESIMTLLPPSSQPHLKSVEASTRASYRVKGLRSESRLWDHLSRPYWLAIALLMLGLAALIFWPLKRYPGASTVSASVVAEPAVPVPATTELALPPTALVPSPALEAAQVVGAVANPIVDGSGSTTGILSLMASGASWVEVTDATGVVQLRKTMSQGEVQGVSGALPMAVVLGRAGVMSVRIRDVPLDLGAVTKDNVARFEVK
ncbi:MAG: helix-turn-helix domain-containing protein [Betaproteobacteria bacterium]|nr:helix-turn-helix domain-containing protein [Betaproteobacteria bacterium]